jgi:hypothetical protein
MRETRPLNRNSVSTGRYSWPQAKKTGPEGPLHDPGNPVSLRRQTTLPRDNCDQDQSHQHEPNRLRFWDGCCSHLRHYRTLIVPIVTVPIIQTERPDVGAGPEKLVPRLKNVPDNSPTRVPKAALIPFCVCRPKFTLMSVPIDWPDSLLPVAKRLPTSPSALD